MNKILAIDPGLKKYGYCTGKINTSSFVVEMVGDVHNNSSLKGIFLNIRDLILCFRPNTIVLEKIFMNTNPKTSFYLNSARSMVILLSQLYSIELVELNATSIKKIVLNHGHASKENIKQFILSEFNIDIDSNGADAILIACAYRNLFLSNKHYSFITSLT